MPQSLRRHDPDQVLRVSLSQQRRNPDENVGHYKRLVWVVEICVRVVKKTGFRRVAGAVVGFVLWNFVKCAVSA